MTARPSEVSSTVASSTDVIGSRSITAHMAPIPIAAPATGGSPGRCDSASPPTAPANMAGKTGPPRNPLIDTA